MKFCRHLGMISCRDQGPITWRFMTPSLKYYANDYIPVLCNIKFSCRKYMYKNANLSHTCISWLIGNASKIPGAQFIRVTIESIVYGGNDVFVLILCQWVYFLESIPPVSRPIHLHMDGDICTLEMAASNNETWLVVKKNVKINVVCSKKNPIPMKSYKYLRTD